ncbi:hypothetical protein AB670_00075 [Chryseobacterium sp. MOF25P]|uniref:hypothetical protein n=1 Tax=unclassified Chryseobacterium TaxID=2593645 RepID=UPI000804A0AC|nr:MULTISPECIES: hypothetical protein [unclassified Chryseobacterium]OBW43545.1 hypothetical protein AB670_00075 [Chryseobacterium sp. MOF25P]OBW46681.1 hypothetical protein AB671_01176 [Chryseobacterium sp. BGARF1]
MKTNICFLIILFLIFSCKTKKERLENLITDNTRTYINEELKNSKDGGEIQSIKFINSDSLTELDESLMYHEHLKKDININLEIVKLQQEKANLYKSINMGEKEDSYVFKDAKEKSQIHLDSAQYLLLKVQKITERLPKLDTIKPIYLLNKVFVKIKKKNATIQEDTLKITSDLNGNLITTSEAIKRVSNKYK